MPHFCNSCNKKLSTWSARFDKADTVFCTDCFQTDKASRVIEEKLARKGEQTNKVTYPCIKDANGIKGPLTKKEIFNLYESDRINEETIIGAGYEGEAPNEESFKKLRETQTFAEFEEIRTEHIVLTTETSFPPGAIQERLGIITAECAFGMNLFRDFFAGMRDLVGGRSKATQNVLKDARTTVLAELKNEAYELGADAVVAVDLDYSELSGGGKSMLFIVDSGTAVKLNSAVQEPAPPEVN